MESDYTSRRDSDLPVSGCVAAAAAGRTAPTPTEPDSLVVAVTEAADQPREPRPGAGAAEPSEQPFP